MLEGKQQPALMIVEDFDGHVGFVGIQKVGEGEEIVFSWMQKYIMILLSNDFECKGLYTY